MTHSTTPSFGLDFDWWQRALENKREHDRYTLLASLALLPEDRAFAEGMAQHYQNRALRCAERAMEDER